MSLFRTVAGEIMTRKPADQFFFDGTNKFYTDSDGKPVGPDGQPVPGKLVTQFVYNFEEYLAEFPEAEKYRNWLTGKANRPGTRFMILQASPWWACTPGCCYIVTQYRRFDHPKNPKYSMKPSIFVNDGDDADAIKRFETEEEADKAFEELKLLAPFALPELYEFGYERY